MFDATKILARVRHYGAQLILDDGKLRVVNGNRLPPDAAHFIATNRADLINLLGDEVDEIEERAAIVEFDGGAPRDVAMAFARTIARAKAGGMDAGSLPRFLDACGRIIDEEFGRAA